MSTREQKVVCNEPTLVLIPIRRGLRASYCVDGPSLQGPQGVKENELAMSGVRPTHRNKQPRRISADHRPWRPAQGRCSRMRPTSIRPWTGGVTRALPALSGGRIRSTPERRRKNHHSTHSSRNTTQTKLKNHRLPQEFAPTWYKGPAGEEGYRTDKKRKPH
jgi:hypothetical protein